MAHYSLYPRMILRLTWSYHIDNICFHSHIAHLKLFRSHFDILRYVFKPSKLPIFGPLICQKIQDGNSASKRDPGTTTSTSRRDFKKQSCKSLVVYGSQAPDGIVFHSKNNAICQWNFENLLNRSEIFICFTIHKKTEQELFFEKYFFLLLKKKKKF